MCWVDGATGAREPGDARRTGPSDTCSPIEPKPHVWVGREQQQGHGLVDVKKRVQISPTSLQREGGRGGSRGQSGTKGEQFRARATAGACVLGLQKSR